MKTIQMTKKKVLVILLAVGSFFLVNSAFATNDITIDGVLGDWNDENGFFLDAYADATPARTDITQYGLTVVKNNPNPESLALVMVTDDYKNTGNSTGDSHQMVFYVGPYEILVLIQSGCDAVNWVKVNGASTTAYSAVAAAPVNPPIYANPPQNDTTADCAMEIEFPISTLPLLDSNSDGKLLDESFITTFATRQSGGVGNDSDTGDHKRGISPTAVALQEISARMSTEIYIVPTIMLGSLLALAIVGLRRRKDTRRSTH